MVFDDQGGVEVDASDITSVDAPYELVKTMRASILVLGPLAARFGKARVSLPGGCAIGVRPVDLHLNALAQMGAEITQDAGYINISVPGGHSQGCTNPVRYRYGRRDRKHYDGGGISRRRHGD